ncbi:hypothetical protein NZNM25_03000 [Nitrosopumilus zosterae]|uniref:Uncharacterized protein n=1 Tax=Nitrosopumilus zosterae TaxID=718286 RepID=A0A2S2KPF2_9ARCH|nr:hypothetical protein [Nitrosopumilus zosterae]BDQ31299.1 hypothetical protein NZOSNM25_001412 [Nitrosopumilus zosterae]GBH33509.1 hypothetical protein NZNM25_03000 [Nitrosopumilus zosterae]
MSNEKNKQTELESIKNLLILLLIKSGATSSEIATCLGVDSSGIRKKFPTRKNKSKGGD